jgi:hypothetical protein
MEKILENLEEIKVKIRGNKGAAKREPSSQKKNRTTKGLREEFKNKENKSEEDKNMSERVARLERQMENEERRRRKNNIVTLLYFALRAFGF